MAGWIKLHRKLLEWEWYDDINTTRLWIHILLKANTEAKKWHGVDIPAGTFITSYATLSEETGLSVMQVRTSMGKLESTKNITRKITSQYQAVSVEKWATYQSKPSEVTSSLTGEQQADNKRITTTKEYKEYKNPRSEEDKITPLVFPPTDFSERLRTAVEAWLSYKQERRENYKPTGLNAMLTQIKNNAAKYGDDAVIEIINVSMASNYQGIMFDRLKKGKGGDTNGTNTGNAEPLEGTDTDGRHWRIWNGYKLYD